MKNAIVLIIDGLGTGAIGPYGSTQVETPALNRFASRAILAEQVMVDSADLRSQYRSYLHGGHAAFSSTHYEPGGRFAQGLPIRLRELGVSSRFIADRQTSESLDFVNLFDEQIQVELERPTKLAAEPEETWMAGFFSSVLESLESQGSKSQLTWIHCPGMCAAWDAPYDFRTLFVAEDDPDPPSLVNVPNEVLKTIDPDYLLGFTCAYNAQVMVLDMVLEVVFKAIQSLPGETLTVLAGARGFPVAEHGVVGVESAPMQAELLQVPVMIQSPVSLEEASRYLHLIQSGDLHTTLANWFGVETDHDPGCDLRIAETDLDSVHRQLAVAIKGSETVIRTPCWFARCFDKPKVDSASWCQLYLKPDDRWNFSDVSSRCPEVVADLLELLKQMPNACLHGDFSALDIPARLLVYPE